MTERRELAVATDQELARLFDDADKLIQEIEHYTNEAHRVVRDKQKGGWNGPWLMTWDEVLEAGDALDEDYKEYIFDPTLAKKVAAEEALEANRLRQRDLNQTWAENGRWNRYFIVKNNNGHVHRGMNCTTCYLTTQYGWLIELADCDEAEMVAEYGELACTVCFPDAPTMKGFGDGTSGIAKLVEAEKAAKQAEKDAKAAAKAAKAITQPDGQPLREKGQSGEPGRGMTIKTERAASIALTNALQNVLVFGYQADNHMPQAHYLAEALAAKRGVTVEEIMKDHEQKARKRK